MIITLDNGQTVIIYEKQNIIPQIKDYIDKEIFELIEDNFSDADENNFIIEDLEEKLGEANNYIDELLEKIEKLEDELDG